MELFMIKTGFYDMCVAIHPGSSPAPSSRAPLAATSMCLSMQGVWPAATVLPQRCRTGCRALT